ncbi:hypothetical protein [Arthrobacter sp. JZ12]|uniref:hypothetical protein n=1 Tax=Arthrobacter sp. JZ12 TaxID=2654190 RepID=UPI002B470341|nr:hypothetical protein [Arthrobacter sp. JZ12]
MDARDIELPRSLVHKVLTLPGGGSGSIGGPVSRTAIWTTGTWSWISIRTLCPGADMSPSFFR